MVIPLFYLVTSALGGADSNCLGGKTRQVDRCRRKSLASKGCPKATADAHGTAHGQHVGVIVWLLLGDRQERDGGGGKGAQREERRTSKGGEDGRRTGLSHRQSQWSHLPDPRDSQARRNSVRLAHRK